MKKIVFKNGCSGEKGFEFAGKNGVSGYVLEDGTFEINERESCVEVVYYYCNECEGEWNLEEEEEILIQ